MQVNNKPEISPHLKHPLQRKFTIRAPDGTEKELEAQGADDCYLTSCPFCNESLSFDFDLRVGNRTYSCHKCGVNGNIVRIDVAEPLPPIHVVKTLKQALRDLRGILEDRIDLSRYDCKLSRKIDMILSLEDKLSKERTRNGQENDSRSLR